MGKSEQCVSIKKDIAAAKYNAKNKAKLMKLTQKKKKTKPNPHFHPCGEKKRGNKPSCRAYCSKPSIDKVRARGTLHQRITMAVETVETCVQLPLSI